LSDGLRANWLRIVTHIGALVPLAVLATDYWTGRLIIDPVREATTRTGRTALILLVLSLACTPVYRVTGFRQVLRVRRTLGLYSFAYITLHLLVFAGLDYGFDLALLGPAILTQRFVLAGVGAFLILLPLAITSTRRWQQRLGRDWRRLHRLLYLAAILDILHFTWAVKDVRRPLRYGALVALLLATRIPPIDRALGALQGLLERARQDTA